MWNLKCRVSRDPRLQAMRIENVISGYAFSRNPVWVCAPDGDGFLNPGERGRFVVSRMGARVFECVVTSPVRVNVSDILEAVSEPVGEGTADGSGLRRLEDGHTVADRRFEFWLEDMEGDRSDPVSCVVIPGGVSVTNYRRLASLATDIFTARFLRSKGNFFLTARSSSWILPVPETELAPLAFIQAATGTVTVREAHTGTEISFRQLEAGIWAIDLEELRERFVSEHDILPSVMDVFRDGEFACRVVVELAGNARDRSRVRFRNSFGIPEIVSLAASPSLSLSSDDGNDESSNRRYDPVTDSFGKSRPRKASGKVYEFSEVMIPPASLDLFKEMLASEDVWLLDVAPVPVKVIPSCEDFRHGTRPDSPVSLTVSFETCEETDCFMGEMTGADDSLKPRLFSNQFVKQFN